jgi:hypothetical protein
VSIEKFTEIWEHSPQQGEKLLVLLALANGTDHSGSSMVHPGYVATRARITEERLDIVLDELEASGDIHVYCNGYGGCLGVNLLKPWNTPIADQPLDSSAEQSYISEITGYVYVLKCGEHFKIGHTIQVSKRMLQLSIQLPYKPQLVHVIATDEHERLEDTIHDYFDAYRLNGEWFELTSDHLHTFRHWGCDHGGVIDERRRSHVYINGKGFHVPEEFYPE